MQEKEYYWIKDPKNHGERALAALTPEEAKFWEKSDMMIGPVVGGQYEAFYYIAQYAQNVGENYHNLKNYPITSEWGLIEHTRDLIVVGFSTMELLARDIISYCRNKIHNIHISHIDK